MDISDRKYCTLFSHNRKTTRIEPVYQEWFSSYISLLWPLYFPCHTVGTGTSQWSPPSLCTQPAAPLQKPSKDSFKYHCIPEGKVTAGASQTKY